MDETLVKFIQDVLLEWHDQGCNYRIEGGRLYVDRPEGRTHRIDLPGVKQALDATA